jgi:hypothetical protein
MAALYYNMQEDLITASKRIELQHAKKSNYSMQENPLKTYNFPKHTQDYTTYFNKT